MVTPRRSSAAKVMHRVRGKLEPVSLGGPVARHVLPRMDAGGHTHVDAGILAKRRARRTSASHSSSELDVPAGGRRIMSSSRLPRESSECRLRGPSIHRGRMRQIRVARKREWSVARRQGGEAELAEARHARSASRQGSREQTRKELAAKDVASFCWLTADEGWGRPAVNELKRLVEADDAVSILVQQAKDVGQHGGLPSETTPAARAHLPSVPLRSRSTAAHHGYTTGSLLC